MLSLSPTLAKRASLALETVARAPLQPLINRDMPRNLSAVPPAVRSLPPALQIVALADMLADARKAFELQTVRLQMLKAELKAANASLEIYLSL